MYTPIVEREAHDLVLKKIFTMNIAVNSFCIFFLPFFFHLIQCKILSNRAIAFEYYQCDKVRNTLNKKVSEKKPKQGSPSTVTSLRIFISRDLLNFWTKLLHICSFLSFRKFRSEINNLRHILKKTMLSKRY